MARRFRVTFSLSGRAYKQFRQACEQEFDLPDGKATPWNVAWWMRQSLCVDAYGKYFNAPPHEDRVKDQDVVVEEYDR